MQILPPGRQPLILLPDAKPDVNVRPDDRSDDAAVVAISQMVLASDEMAAALSQFRNRRHFESQAEHVLGGFEKVLDEDAVPKAQQILAAAKMGDRPIEWLLQMARSLFSDDSDLVLVLRELVRQKHLPEATRQRLSHMLRLAMSEASPKRLKSGINCALKARLFGKTLGLHAGLMRETYRTFLESDGGPVADYEDWIALYGYRHRSHVLSFIEAALLTDIDALDPSCSSSEFGELLARLGQLKRLRSADECFIARLLIDDLIRSQRLDEAELLVLMLGLLRYPDELDELLEGGFGNCSLLMSHAEHSRLLGVIRQAVALLPVELFVDDGASLRLAERFTALTDSGFSEQTIERHACHC